MVRSQNDSQMIKDFKEGRENKRKEVKGKGIQGGKDAENKMATKKAET